MIFRVEGLPVSTAYLAITVLFAAIVAEAAAMRQRDISLQTINPG